MIDEPVVNTPHSYPSGVRRSPVGAVEAIAISYRLVLGQMRSPGRIVALFLLAILFVLRCQALLKLIPRHQTASQ